MKFNSKNSTVHTILVLLFAITFYSCSQDSDKSTDTKDVVLEEVNAFEQNEKLGIGVNLGNALEAPNEGEWGVTLSNDFFEAISRAGFKSVRVPIRWSAHAETSSSYTISKSFFDRIDWVVKTAFFYDLMVIINIHHYEEFMDDPENHKARYLSFWEQIGERYKNHSHNLLFEILNEPTGNVTNHMWNGYLAEAIDVIRVTNPGRTIVVGTGNWSNVRAINDLVLPYGENNVIVSFHYYDPFIFTHQGAEWVDGSNAWLGTTFTASAAERNAINDHFTMARIYSDEHNVPINVDEFGSYNKADMDSRYIWTSYIARAIENNNFSGQYWEFCSGFGIYNQTSGTYYNGLVKALLPEWEP